MSLQICHFWSLLDPVPKLSEIGHLVYWFWALGKDSGSGQYQKLYLGNLFKGMRNPHFVVASAELCLPQEGPNYVPRPAFTSTRLRVGQQYPKVSWDPPSPSSSYHMPVRFCYWMNLWHKLESEASGFPMRVKWCPDFREGGGCGPMPQNQRNECDLDFFLNLGRWGLCSPEFGYDSRQECGSIEFPMKGKSQTGSQERGGNGPSTKPVTDPSLSLPRIINLGLYYLYFIRA